MSSFFKPSVIAKDVDLDTHYFNFYTAKTFHREDFKMADSFKK